MKTARIFALPLVLVLACSSETAAPEQDTGVPGNANIDAKTMEILPSRHRCARDRVDDHGGARRVAEADRWLPRHRVL